LETSLSLSLALVRDGIIDPIRLTQLMSCNPARILGVAGGSLRVGEVADVTVIDPERKFIFSAEKSCSKGRNTPFDGWNLQGKAIMTLVAGKITHEDS